MTRVIGSMPLTWTKIGEIDDETGLYLCDLIVDYRKFDSESNCWDSSEIRKWLNDTFYGAFSDNEKQLIVKNKETNDNVFLLSKCEYDRFIESIPILFTCWWLRSPGRYADRALVVYGSGGVSIYGDEVSEDNIGVRPAILMKKLHK